MSTISAFELSCSFIILIESKNCTIITGSFSCSRYSYKVKSSPSSCSWTTISRFPSALNLSFSGSYLPIWRYYLPSAWGTSRHCLSKTVPTFFASSCSISHQTSQRPGCHVVNCSAGRCIAPTPSAPWSFSQWRVRPPCTFWWPHAVRISVHRRVSHFSGLLGS